jgi:iron-sulfur cluster repair protein YtfE (RIC family)
MTVKTIISDYLFAHPEEFPREFKLTRDIEQINSDDIEFIKDILNVLKNLKSKKKTLTIMVGNLNK